MFFSTLSLIVRVLFSQFTSYLIITFGLVYYLATKNNEFFEKQGVKYKKPHLLVGNLWPTISRQKNFFEHYKSLYDEFKDVGFFGYFEFTRPILMIRDPDIVKQICIKDFDSFVNHRISIDLDVDPIFGRNLFVMKDNKWRLMRNMMSPAFTGTKMRFLFSSIRDSIKNTTDYLVEEAEKNNGIYEFEARDLFTRCGTEIIASAAFGVEVNSIKNKEDDFYTNAIKMANFTKLKMTLKTILCCTWPNFAKFFKLKLLDNQYIDFFKSCLLGVMRSREESKSPRSDFVQILMEAKAKGKIELEKGEVNEYVVGKEESKNEWTEDDFVAQSLAFFLAGFETVTTLFNFLSYELAINPDIQEKLLAEIDVVQKQCKGNPVDYDAIHNMEYLDMVIKESLRKHPPLVGMARVCNKQITLKDKTGQECTLQFGDQVIAPVAGFHRDAKYWPDPEKFDPERFNDENKHKIDSGVYQPFGMGPRQCIGNRFALMEAKIIFFYLLSVFKILPCKKTQIPLQYKKGTFFIYAKDGMWLNFKLRK